MTSIPLLTDTELRGTSSDGEAGFGALETERGRLPLKAMDVETRISGLVAHIKLRQTFTNTIDEPVEATYIFPLPSRGAVTSFQMAIGERVIDGVLKERGEARQEYREAIEAGHRAAITEEERPDVFNLRVGNLMPGEEAEVRLTITAPLPFVEGEATFRFPLVVAPRYIPGVPIEGGSVGAGVAVDTDAVPDASRITPPVLLPGFPNPVALSLAVELDTRGLEARDVRSSLHSVIDDADSDTEGQGRWRRIEVRPGERLDRDFILRFRVADDTVTSAVIASPDDEAAGTDDGHGTFQLTLLPPSERGAASRDRDVVFVLDRSGSMSGWKMVAARRALGRMVDTLTESDRFGVIAFDNSQELSPGFDGESLVKATDRERYRTIEFLSKLEARGGTEMARPLLRAAKALAGGYADRDRILVLVTDGQIGNEAQILQNLQKPLGRTRVFTLGIDRAVNKSFLERLAALGGGDCELVESEERLDEVMRRIHRRIDTPVLTEVMIDAEGPFELARDGLVPSRIPDLFAGAPLSVYGRYRGEPKGTLRIRATDASGQKWERSVDISATEQPALGALWARGRLRDLEDAYNLERGGSKKAAEIVEISLRHGVLCRFTAFVAVDRSETVNAGGERHQVAQPVEMPSGWEMQAQAPPPAPLGAIYGNSQAFASLKGGGGFAPGGGGPYPGAPAPRAKKARGGFLKKAKAAVQSVLGEARETEEVAKAEGTWLSHGPGKAASTDPGQVAFDRSHDLRPLEEALRHLERVSSAHRDAKLLELARLRDAVTALSAKLPKEQTGRPGSGAAFLAELERELAKLEQSDLSDGVVDVLHERVCRLLRRFLGQPELGGSKADPDASPRRDDFWKV